MDPATDQVHARAADTLDRFLGTASSTRAHQDPAAWFAQVTADLNTADLPTYIYAAVLAEALCRLADRSYRVDLAAWE